MRKRPVDQATLREHFAWNFGTRATVHAAVAEGPPCYGPHHFMNRNRFRNGYSRPRTAKNIRSFRWIKKRKERRRKIGNAFRVMVYGARRISAANGVATRSHTPGMLLRSALSGGAGPVSVLARLSRRTVKREFRQLIRLECWSECYDTGE